MSKVVFVAACVVLPVVWGVLVNWLFQLWRERTRKEDEDRDSIFPDYQI